MSMMGVAASRVVLYSTVALLGRDAAATEADSTTVFSSVTAAEDAVATTFSLVPAAAAAFRLVTSVDFFGA